MSERKERRRLSTQKLGVASLSAFAATVGVAATAPGANAAWNQYWYGCAPPTYNHKGPTSWASRTVQDKVHAWGGCNGGTGAPYPCYGWYYDDHQPWPTSDYGSTIICTNVASGTPSGGDRRTNYTLKPLARICGYCNGTHFYNSHYDWGQSNTY